MASRQVENTTQRKSPTQARSRQRVNLILESTRELLRDQGLIGFTTTAIATKAGIPVSSVYQYFPDKKAILAAIYIDYLARIREVYSEFEDQKYDALDRKRVLDKLLMSIFQAELRDHIEDAMEKAIRLYPELEEIDRQHREKNADILASLLRRLGSRWSMPKLRRLAQYLYCINSGIWVYRVDVQPPKKECMDWQLSLFHSMISQCFD